MTNPRALLAALHDAAVQGAAPFARTRGAVHRWWQELLLPPVPDMRVYVVALGKAAPAMAAGAVAALTELRVAVTDGIVVGAHVPTPRDWHEVPVPDVLRVHVGDHPVPGPNSTTTRASDRASESARWRARNGELGQTVATENGSRANSRRMSL